MSPLKSSLIAGLASALVTAGVFYFAVGRERQEIAALRTANEKLRAESLARSDARKSAMKPKTDSATSPSLLAARAPETLPKADALYRNEGQATPVATLHTFAWACDRGDVAMVARLLMFGGGGRAKVEAIMAKLPEKMRSQWKTPEELAATVCIHGYMKWPYPPAAAIDLAETESLGPDRMKIRLPGTTVDGGNYQRTDEGWKFVIPEAGIDDHIAKNFSKTTAAP